ncbi:hypothetical protein VTN02DRAFT_6630 [Thermoascus thermophilus]
MRDEGCLEVSGVVLQVGVFDPSPGRAREAGVIGGDPRAVRRDGGGAAESRPGVNPPTSIPITAFEIFFVSSWQQKAIRLCRVPISCMGGIYSMSHFFSS